MDVFMYTMQVNIYVYVDTSSKAVFLCPGMPQVREHALARVH